MLNCHKNVPGVLSSINSALASVGVNIVAQQLGTSDNVGYLIVDMNAEASDEAIKAIKSLDSNVKTRLLY